MDIEAKRAKSRQYYHDLKKRLGEEEVFKIRRKRNNDNRTRKPEDYLFYEARGRAKKRSLEFTIEKSDVVIPETCPILGIPLKSNRGSTGPSIYSPTLDRVDNTKGYTKENTKIISWKANKMKCDASLADLKAVVKYIEDHIKQQESVSSAAS